MGNVASKWALGMTALEPPGHGLCVEGEGGGRCWAITVWFDWGMSFFTWFRILKLFIATFPLSTIANIDQMKSLFNANSFVSRLYAFSIY